MLRERAERKQKDRGVEGGCAAAQCPLETSSQTHYGKAYKKTKANGQCFHHASHLHGTYKLAASLECLPRNAVRTLAGCDDHRAVYALLMHPPTHKHTATHTPTHKRTHTHYTHNHTPTPTPTHKHTHYTHTTTPTHTQTQTHKDTLACCCGNTSVTTEHDLHTPPTEYIHTHTILRTHIHILSTHSRIFTHTHILSTRILFYTLTL